jgi:hypothetical protein
MFLLLGVRDAAPEVPNEFLCPLSLEILKEPVVAMDGHTYGQCLDLICVYVYYLSLKLTPYFTVANLSHKQASFPSPTCVCIVAL